MDNEEDYIELHRLLAKCKFNLVREQVKPRLEEEREYFASRIEKISNLMVDIPIIIKGDER
ncbi:MAG: hypothetical protein HFJ50_06525 [Clostridia bacterium]|jgi:hypothetical protein|nr:hypothetical protein [Clostridia bacterium]